MLNINILGKVLGGACIVLFQGCTSHAGNEIIYALSQPTCSIKEHQTLSELDKCKEELKNRPSYEEYQKERKKIIKGKHPKEYDN